MGTWCGPYYKQVGGPTRGHRCTPEGRKAASPMHTAGEPVPGMSLPTSLVRLFGEWHELRVLCALGQGWGRSGMKAGGSVLFMTAGNAGYAGQHCSPEAGCSLGKRGHNGQAKAALAA